LEAPERIRLTRSGATRRGRRREGLSESRMRESRLSGSMGGAAPHRLPTFVAYHGGESRTLLLRLQLAFVRRNECPNVVRHVEQLEPLFFV
jgi:hypothetical protein